MALGLEEKQKIVSEVNGVAIKALSAVVADYRGMEVSEMTQLRRQARESGIYLRVVRNSLMRRAVIGTDFECLTPVLEGPNLVGFSMNEPGSVARLFRDIAKDHEVFDVVGLAVDGQLIAAENIDLVARLPSKEESVSLLMSVIKAPIVKLAGTLKEVPAKFVRTVSAVAEAKKK